MAKKPISDRRRILLRAAKTFSQERYTISGGKRKIAPRPITLPVIKSLVEDRADLDPVRVTTTDN